MFTIVIALTVALRSISPCKLTGHAFMIDRAAATLVCLLSKATVQALGDGEMRHANQPASAARRPAHPGQRAPSRPTQVPRHTPRLGGQAQRTPSQQLGLQHRRTSLSRVPGRRARQQRAQRPTPEASRLAAPADAAAAHRSAVEGAPRRPRAGAPPPGPPLDARVTDHAPFCR